MTDHSQVESRTMTMTKGMALAIFLIGLGLSMLLWPSLIEGTGSMELTNKSRTFMSVVGWIWTVPGGIISIILGALIGFGTYAQCNPEKF